VTADCCFGGERRPFDGCMNVAPRSARDALEYCCIQAKELPSVAPAARLYEGGPLVKPCVRFLTPQVPKLPGERCRVKRLSKVTGVNSKGS
jgi:hypothetical protein